MKGGKTFFWSGNYHNDLNSRDTLATELNVLADFQPKVPQNYKNAEVVMLGNLHPMVQISVLDQMDRETKISCFRYYEFLDGLCFAGIHQVMKRVDVITINDEEARQLSGEYSLVKAAAKIHTMGPKYVVIKKGEHGALLFHEKKFSLHQLYHLKKYLIQQELAIPLQEVLQDILHKAKIYPLKT